MIEHLPTNLAIYYRLGRSLLSKVGPAIDPMTSSMKACDVVYTDLCLNGTGSHADLAAHVSTTYLWAAHGFQRVQAEPDLWASFGATAYDGVDTDEIRPPWTGFMLDLPEGLVPFHAEHGALVSVRYVLVSAYDHPATGDRRWSWHGWSEGDPDDTALYEINYSTSIMATEEDWKHHPDNEDMFPLETTDVDDRARHMIRRMICGACLAIANARCTQDQEAFQLKSRPRKAREGQPASVITRLARPKVIKLDGQMRQAVRAYVLGGRRALRTLHFVRGHWRMQACGLHRVERRRTWIAPHMRGPKDSTMVVRTTVLQGREAQDG